MSVIGTLISCVAVSFIWGTTNVFLKNSTSDIAKCSGKSLCEQLLNELLFLVANWRCVLPFLVNQLGSVLFYFVLLYNELSLVVPITNSLTFLFTAATSIYFGESVPSKRSVVGAFIVVAGIALCIIDKLSNESPL